MRAVYDMVGVGFGPSNLALASALHESSHAQPLSALFFEAKEKFIWHPNMLLEDAEMQITFLKDLAMMRNPTSPFTFLNYLHKVGRLTSFANLRHFYPSRIEFNDYFTWVAKQLSDVVKYSTAVISIEKHSEHDNTVLEVVTSNQQTGKRQTTLTKNIVVATGGIPMVPKFVCAKQQNSKIWHTERYLSKIAFYKANPQQHYKFCVIGGGQSAAEVAYDLHRSFPNAQVICIHRGFGYKPSDDSEFINEIFNPEYIDLFYSITDSIRSEINTKYSDTNYAAVDSELIQKLYRIKYEEQLTGNIRLHFNRFSSMVALSENESRVEIHTQSLVNSQNKEVIQADAAILATGYHFPSVPPVLKNLNEYLVYDGNHPIVSREHKMVTNPDLSAGIYLQGFNERTHGLSDTLLSVSAIRAQEILNEIIKSKNPAPIPKDFTRRLKSENTMLGKEPLSA